MNWGELAELDRRLSLVWTSQLDMEGSAARLKLLKVLGGGLLSILSTSLLQASGSVPVSIVVVSVSLSVVMMECERESRSSPEPGVSPSSRLLEPADMGRRDTEEEDREEWEVGAIAPDRVHTMIWLS